MEILKLFIGFLTMSWWGVIIPTLQCIWFWLILGLVWLVAGGFASLPLVVWGAKSLNKLCKGRFATSLRTLIYIAAAIGLWLYAHLWTASAVWWLVHVAGLGPFESGGWEIVILLVMFWLIDICALYTTPS